VTTNNDYPHAPAPAAAPGGGNPQAADSLTEALDDLEQLLGDDPDSDPESSGSETGGAQSPVEMPFGPHPEQDGTAEREFLAAQYSIPLLDDVVLPGASGIDPDAGVDSAKERASTSAEDFPPPTPLSFTIDSEAPLSPDEFAQQEPPAPDPRAEQVAARLASELEVIVDARAKASMQAALDEMKREVRRHLTIVLPEILDELARNKPDKE
jgi:hypothetical protein